MSRISLFWNRRRWTRMTSACCCLALMGCMGQKYSLPSFSWKASDKTEATPAAEEKTLADPGTDPAGLANVALNDPVQLGEGELLGDAEILTAFTSNSENGINQQVSLQQQTIEEIDQAFLQGQLSAGQHVEAVEKSSLENYQQVVKSVDEGVSNLDALKQSLDELNSEAVSAPWEEESEAVDEIMQDLAELAEATAAPIEAESPAIEEIVSAEGKQGEEFPWARGIVNSAVNSAATTTATATEVTLTRVRSLLTRSNDLIQQNNFLAARTVAESAQQLLKKTQSALSPGEVTPEQVLAEIQARQAQQQEQKTIVTQTPNGQDSTVTVNKPVPAKPGVPVVIDLSREWINTPAHNPAQRTNDISQFAQATVKANQGASLPTISPGVSTAKPTPAERHIPHLEKQPAANPGPVLGTQPQAPINHDPDVVRLGDVPTGKNYPALILSNDESQTIDSAPSFTTPPMLIVNDDSAVNDFNFQSQAEAPLLMAPGNSASTLEQGSDFDEFAADFAGVTVDNATVVGQAPLMIDELDLETEPKIQQGFPPTTMLMTMCGIVFVVLLLFRWRS